MTHVLDPLIGYLDQKPTEGCACKICEGCREGLRILRAEREGRRDDDAAKWRQHYEDMLDGYEQVVAERNKLQDEVDELRAEREGRRDCESARNYAIGEGMAIGQLNERRKAMEWLHRRGLHSEAWALEKCKHLSPILKPSDRAAELRAEGRRDAVAFLRQRFEEEDDIAEKCLEPILAQAERGDHWRGGEG